MILNNINVTADTDTAIPFSSEVIADGVRLTVKKGAVPTGTKAVRFDIPYFNATAGDDGYYVIADIDHRGSQLCYFREKDNYDVSYKQDLMPIWGVKTSNGTVLGVADGMKYCLYMHLGIRDGEYYLYPEFILDGDEPYEDISIELYTLGTEADYSAMGRKYRNLQLERGNCLPIKDKCRDREALRYASESVEIRIRMGWKPAPPKVLEQTVENEPEMKVACTFERVMDIVDELKKQGVDKAQICLIGWNKSGHDGRYPDIFPVEESLGGEAKLRELIEYAQKNGYQIVCHTNSTDCYSISKDFSDDIVIKNKNQELAMNEMPWSGGNMYWLTPSYALEFAKRDLPKVADLGFRGVHYIDVMSVVAPRTDYDKNHPTTAKETVEYYDEIMKLSHKCFGGFASEGCFDFAARYLDYGLYVSWSDCEDKFFDMEIPLWQIVYHGIILSNPSTITVNYCIKDKSSHHKALLYGARPSFYIYSKFMEGSDQDDWLGSEDMICDTDEQLTYFVSKIKEAYDEFKSQIHLQKEFIDEYTVGEDNIAKTVYSDGSVISYKL